MSVAVCGRITSKLGGVFINTLYDTWSRARIPPKKSTVYHHEECFAKMHHPVKSSASPSTFKTEWFINSLNIFRRSAFFGRILFNIIMPGTIIYRKQNTPVENERRCRQKSRRKKLSCFLSDFCSIICHWNIFLFSLLPSNIILWHREKEYRSRMIFQWQENVTHVHIITECGEEVSSQKAK